MKKRKKKIVFNENCDLSPKQKQSIAAKVNGILRTNMTIDRINYAILKISEYDSNVTQKKVAAYLGISLSTVVRNWTKEKISPYIHNGEVDNQIGKKEIPTIEESLNSLLTYWHSIENYKK